MNFECISLHFTVFVLHLPVDRMNYPPTKRLRGVNQDIPTGTTFDDPFGDDDAFSQADLAEIDILASQAFTSTSVSDPATKPVAKPAETAGGSAGKSRLLSRTSATFSRDNKFGFNKSTPSRDPLGEFIARNVISAVLCFNSAVEVWHASTEVIVKQ